MGKSQAHDISSGGGGGVAGVMMKMEGFVQEEEENYRIFVCDVCMW